jgi:hypothetical protein
MARFLKMNSVLALVCVSAVFKNHQIKFWIHCVTRLTLFNYLSSSGRGSGYLYMLTSPREAGNKIPQMTFLRYKPRKLTA